VSDSICETCGRESPDIWCAHCEALLAPGRIVPRLLVAGTGQPVDLGSLVETLRAMGLAIVPRKSAL